MADTPLEDGTTPPPMSSARPRPNIDLLPPGLDKALRTAGVDPQDPNVTKTLDISLNLMMARGSLPLPPPALLSEYDRAFPGLVGKIIEWTESQRSHRLKLEKQVTDGAERRMDRGQFIAGATALCGLGMATICGIIGNPFVACTIAIVAIGGPAAAIVLAARSEKTQSSKPSVTAPTTSGTVTPKASEAER
jgi:uncharacterized membrane protein